MKNLTESRGYSMLCRIKFIPTAMDKETNTRMGNAAIEVTDTEAVKIGDEFSHGRATLVVSEVIEQRNARGIHPQPAIWQKIVCSYTEPNVN